MKTLHPPSPTPAEFSLTARLFANSTPALKAVTSPRLPGSVRSVTVGLVFTWLLVCLPGSALRGQTVWNIPGAGNWNTAGNWNPAAIPNGATTDVTIANGTSTVTLNLSPAVRDLNVAAGNILSFANQQDLFVNRSVVNHGVLYVNQTGNTGSTELIAAADATLSGSGMVRLTRRASGGNSRINSDIGFAWTQQAGHTITGAGIIGASLINLGVVQADVLQATTGNTILLEANPKTNQGIFQATANSVLQIDATTVNNTGGIIRALADSVVSLSSGVTITGGTIESVGTGVVQTSSSLNSVFQDLTINGHVSTASRGDIGLIGAINNTGLIELTAGNATSDTLLEILGTGATVTGGGTISLLGLSGASVTGAGGTLTIVNQTFQGSGDFGRGVISIDNQANGLIHANTTGQALTIDVNAGGLTNSGTLRASNGGSLIINDGFTNSGLIDVQSLIDSNGSLTNSVSGVIRGAGELEVGSQFINSGLIAPGNPAGTLYLDMAGLGLATFNNTSVLEIDLASNSSYDKLDINGNASLDGRLKVNLLGGYLPAPTDVFYFLHSGNDSINTLGVFANVGNGGTLLTAGGEGYFTVNYSDNDFLSDVRLSNFVPIVMPKLWIQISPSGQNAVLHVKAQPNQTVRLMMNLDLNDIDGWDEVTSLQADANGDASYVDPQALTVHPHKFYRLEFNYLVVN